MSKSAFVVKSNELVEASYKLTLDEMRVLLLTIGKIDPTIKNHRRDFEFTVSDFAKRFNVNEKSAYEQVQGAIDKLGSRWATVEDTPKVKTKVTFLTKQSYFKGDGRFRICIHEELMPYVSELSSRFTKYRLEHVSNFTSFHAIRIYEILAQYKSCGQREVLISDLKDWLLVADKYSRYNNFNQRVVTPAINEINAKSDLNVRAEPIKRGRNIVALKFSIASKETAEITKRRPPFPNLRDYGRYAKLDVTNPKNSHYEYGPYALDCLKILEDFYTSIEDVTVEDLKHYWIFLAGNESNKSKLGEKADFVAELKKRGYKLVNCELVKCE